MRVCPDCPTEEEQDPSPSRDQRPWARDGRCLTCHAKLMRAKSARQVEKRGNRTHRVQAKINWARV